MECFAFHERRASILALDDIYLCIQMATRDFAGIRHPRHLSRYQTHKNPLLSFHKCHLQRSLLSFLIFLASSIIMYQAKKSPLLCHFYVTCIFLWTVHPFGAIQKIFFPPMESSYLENLATSHSPDKISCRLTHRKRRCFHPPYPTTTPIFQRTQWSELPSY